MWRILFRQIWRTIATIALFRRPLGQLDLHLYGPFPLFPDKRRRDEDNYSGKLFMDGLTQAGGIADDNFWGISKSIHAPLDKANPGTKIMGLRLEGLERPGLGSDFTARALAPCSWPIWLSAPDMVPRKS